MRHSELCRSLGLPDLSDPYPLEEEQVARYQRDGFIVLESVLSRDEIAVWADRIRLESMRLLDEAGMPLTFGGAFHQRLNLRFDSPVLEGYCLAPRLGSIGVQLSGADAVRIYHEQVLFKPPGANASFWHQDMYFWPLETEQSLGTWERMREAVVVTMYPDGTRVAPLVNEFRRFDAQAFLGGRAEGELADSELNTVLYPPAG